MTEMSLDNIGEAAAQAAVDAPPPEPSKRRPRNYAAMRDTKLLACKRQLLARAGDAYERCMDGGSGDPAADLAKVTALIERRGL